MQNILKTLIMKKSKFYGTDVNNEISLLEYGLLVSIDKHEDNSGTQFCVYRIDDNSFGCGHISENEINELMTDDNSWVKRDDILSFVGCDLNEWLKLNLAHKISDLIQYYGCENIFGTDCSPMTENEVIERYL